MAAKPSFEHRHYVKLADILAGLKRELSDAEHNIVVNEFADALRGTNDRYNRERFLAAAKGEPTNGRDRVR